MFNNYLLEITLFIVAGIIAILILSRSISIQKDNAEDIDVKNNFPSDILNVPGRKSLFFSYETRIVYQMYEEDDIEFLEPFISNNHLCMYVKGRIVEVVNDRIIAIVHTACLPK